MDLFNYAVEEDAGRSTRTLETLHGCYFHGFCDKGDDLVYINSGVVVDPGIHDVVVYGQPAKLLYWVAEDPSWPGGKRPRGLVVLPGTDSEKDATAKYNRKVVGL